MENKSPEQTKPIIVEAFADNGEHSHWTLIDSNTGEKLWSEDPQECKEMGYPVKEQHAESKAKTLEEVNRFDSNKANIKAIERIREVFNETFDVHPTEKRERFETDDNFLVEEFRDEWTWYMQGSKDSFDLQTNNHIEQDQKA